MFAKVAILFAALAAVSAHPFLHGAALAHTGSSVSSRHQDSFGNYAFGYDVVDGSASTKSRSEVGDAFGNKKSSYNSHVNHVAPAHVAVAHAAPLAYAAPLAVAHAAPIAVAHAAPVAYDTKTAVHHVAPSAHLVAGHGLVGAGHLAYAGHGLVAPHVGGIAYGGLGAFHY